MNDLTDMMHRATEYLEPESTDLVERGMRRGAALRRRRSALTGIASASAVLAAAGAIFAGSQAMGADHSAGTPVAGAPIVGMSNAASAAGQPTKLTTTPQETLKTLQSLVPTGMSASKPVTWGDNFIGASVLVNDGKGASLLEVQVQTLKSQVPCANEAHPGNCTTRPDGTIVVADSQPGGSAKFVVAASNSVQVRYSDGRTIVVSSANSTAWKKVPITRAKPLFTVAQLTALADSKAWGFPPLGYGKDLGR